MSSSSAPTGSAMVRANDPYENSESPLVSPVSGAFGFDRQLPVAHGDFDVLDRVDSGKLTAIDGKLANVGKPARKAQTAREARGVD